ncbi:DUF3105 domain-containing protein [Pseudonocardia sp. TRM90224]|uniref:DUF3105 domain-containing protein n=1 Tax=Pseudonocardia sp. TRM90224 TaxID=2812678 RepID=UPI001E56E1EF|nr:DUF3105 domain-containing protein [Pseudonocardia sp. TRM90224]
MVSGKNSKSTRKVKPTVVVRRKATPWGMIAAITAIVLFAGAIGTYYVVEMNAKQARTAALAAYVPSPENRDPSTKIEGVVVKEYKGGQHIDRTQKVAYTNSPPYGGAHDFAWAACSGVVYPVAVRNENMVHSLEHGAIWIAYNPDQVSGAALDTLRAKVDSQPYMLMSPYPGLNQPISLQSWGHQLKLSDANDPRIDQFISSLRLNQYAFPEPGATCNEMGPGNFLESAPPPFEPAPEPLSPGSTPEVTPDAAVVPDAPVTNG